MKDNIVMMNNTVLNIESQDKDHGYSSLVSAITKNHKGIQFTLATTSPTKDTDIAHILLDVDDVKKLLVQLEHFVNRYGND